MQDLSLKSGAIFIADAHENEQRRHFWDFLQALEKGFIQSPQLFLMGDIFDLLVFEVRATHSFAMPYIKVLEKLASKGMQIIYLEGNHDFNLASFFNKLELINLQNQPLNLKTSQKLEFQRAFLKNKAVEFEPQSFIFEGFEGLFLAHGDIFLPKMLSFFLKSLRNKALLRFLNLLDDFSFHAIHKKILNNQNKKNLFFSINDFDKLARERVLKYPKSNALVIEGHYHQDFILNEKTIKYINLASFAYKRSFFVVK